MTDLLLRDPLLDESDLPFGAPDFARIAPDDFVPAFERGIIDARRELEMIADDPAAPTFANTLEAMERVGAPRARAADLRHGVIRAIDPGDTRNRTCGDPAAYAARYRGGARSTVVCPRLQRAAGTRGE